VPKRRGRGGGARKLSIDCLRGTCLASVGQYRMAVGVPSAHADGTGVAAADHGPSTGVGGGNSRPGYTPLSPGHLAPSSPSGFPAPPAAHVTGRGGPLRARVLIITAREFAKQVRFMRAVTGAGQTGAANRTAPPGGGRRGAVRAFGGTASPQG
jgi:hypothetical protein